jgi:hypothetical protein
MRDSGHLPAFPKRIPEKLKAIRERTGLSSIRLKEFTICEVLLDGKAPANLIFRLSQE